MRGVYECACIISLTPVDTYIYRFSRRFYPKRLTRMYTHFTLMAHCTSGAIRGDVSCSRMLRQGIELTTFCLLNDFSTSCTTVAPVLFVLFCSVVEPSLLWKMMIR